MSFDHAFPPPIIASYYAQDDRAPTFLAVFDPQLRRVTRSVFVGSEQFLPSVPRFTIGGGFAYVTGQVTITTGPAFGNFLGAVPLP
jgi:hypothetical protein